jgi:hypothetical protein
VTLQVREVFERYCRQRTQRERLNLPVACANVNLRDTFHGIEGTALKGQRSNDHLEQLSVRRMVVTSSLQYHGDVGPSVSSRLI